MHNPNPNTVPFQSAEPLDPNAWIPLSHLAVEGFGIPQFGADTLESRVANLRNQLADEILLDDIGRACVPRSLARQLFTERAQQQAEAAAREAARAAELAAKNPMDEVRALIEAIDARHERLLAAGMLDADMPAFAVMAAGDHQARMEAKGRHLDEMMRSGLDGSLTMHRFDQEEG